MIDEYFDFYQKGVSEYGENTTVFYQNGAFYEIYQVNDKEEKIGNADKIEKITGLFYTSKNKMRKLQEDNCSNRSNPDFVGFGVSQLQKYVVLLLEFDYTIVVVDQLEESSNKKGKTVKRGIVAIYSPTLQPLDFNNDNDQNGNSNLVTILFQQPKKGNLVYYSLCSVNNITNHIELLEGSISIKQNIIEDELSRLLTKFAARELLIKVCGPSDFVENVVRQFFIDNFCSKYKHKIERISEELLKQYSSSDFQNKYIQEVYDNVNFGITSPIEHFSLECYQLSTANFLFTLDFIGKHDKKYISNLSSPKVIEEHHNMKLELNTLTQLNITSSYDSRQKRNSSVFNVVNFTSTSIGRRSLKKLLANPFKCSTKIEKRYNLTTSLQEAYRNEFFENKFEICINNISDFEKLHRKMGLHELHPFEFEKLDCNYNTLLELITLINSTTDNTLISICPSNDDINSFEKYRSSYNLMFDLNEMKKFTLTTSNSDITNYFRTGAVKELDNIQEKINSLEVEIENMRCYYDKFINKSPSGGQMIKVSYTDQEGYHFVCTKIRYQNLTQILDKAARSKLTSKQTSNMCKIFTDELSKLSTTLINNRELLARKIKLHYLNRLSEYYDNNYKLFEVLAKFVALIDVTKSNMKCALKYNYCKPKVIDSDGAIESYLEAKELRHPLIERLCPTEYIPNDIKLNSDSCGNVLYGLNSSGKSSLLRAIGVSIILAQCGLFVPCKSFVFVPFNTIVSQVDLTDNLFTGKSSFVTEMVGLKKIMECAGPNTLVLADELCRGTEVNSATSIVAATILKLLETNTKFFFTTHLHTLPIIESIKRQNKLWLCHLSVESRPDGNIVFERKLKEGSGSELYGLEVAKSIIQIDDFIETAFDVRSEILKKSSKTLSNKKSRYNTKKLVDKCEICNHVPQKGGIPLDTHHVNFQKDCDQNGFINGKHFHKNEIYNLVTLCKACHKKIDTEELIVFGYKQGTNGLFLDYILN